MDAFFIALYDMKQHLTNVELTLKPYGIPRTYHRHYQWQVATTGVTKTRAQAVHITHRTQAKARENGGVLCFLWGLVGNIVEQIRTS
jgi:hypothetical protein